MTSTVITNRSTASTASASTLPATVATPATRAVPAAAIDTPAAVTAPAPTTDAPTTDAPATPAPDAPRAHAPGEPLIVAQGLERRYGSGRTSHLAVAGIDLTITRGQLFALLGTNGAGKTSTLEVLEGLARPTGGSARVFGHDPYRERRHVRPRQGLMLQTGGFPPDLTAAEALTMWTSTLTAPRPVTAVLADVDLADKARTRISSLSGGELRRLDLACAIAGDPELLFLDEPTTGLDPESRARAWELIRGLKERGTTIVLTTHHLEEAESLADELAIMHRGRIVRRGAVEEVVAGHPATIRAALGAPTVPDLPALRGSSTLDRRGRLEITTEHLNDDLLALLTWAREHGVELTGLDARAASLESVFLEIAGSDPTGSDPAAPADTTAPPASTAVNATTTPTA
ncbi:ABC transporter ATP-binding protein [Brachybacterium muris]|uniref:ABC transporter ATP-binding protein n=1 Tax=Brachybacterium muris TaxID=219301 RepID=UPI00223B4BA2|nr:ABC transporter ATP-binding protein [Brachybacterium muris]MCT2178648.1 ABC transporter ATP-binding protein [Brachybacterium muris]